MPTRSTAALFALILMLATLPERAGGQNRPQQDPEEQAARLRVERAQARMQSIRRSLAAAENRQRQIMREVEQLRGAIVEGEGIITQNEAQVEATRGERREADAKVDQAEQTRDRTKEEMDVKRAAIEEEKTAAVKAFEATEDFRTLVETRDDARTRAEAAMKTCLERLAETAAYKNALTAREAAEKRLDEVRSTGDTMQITAASQSAMEAKNRVSLLEDKAYADDPVVVETRAQLKTAEDRMAAARAEYEKRWLASADAAQVRSDAEAAEKTYLASVKARTEADDQRKALDRRLGKMAAELTSRKRKLADAKERAKAMEREIDQLTTRIRGLQVDLSSAEGEYRLAVTQLQRIIGRGGPGR